ncbi:ABC transporter, putative [Bodo saltans]|uniref:ABC transporter, putative n=1 Tax=Bodo saltans TaxID=75058 RepID=A0A0S4KJT2_BODSA|nr:ABC transporter, putative [Bodo saltans]|eukprot:CUI11835.1 ABC transporter, putative [Bodo saltans]
MSTLEVVASTDGKEEEEDSTDVARCSSSSRILLDTIPHDAVRTKLFGYVPQHPTILAGTVAQNVAMIQSVTYGGSSSVRGDGQPTSASVLQRVRDACQQAQCASFVAALPDGLLTFLAPSHSGGGANSGVGSRCVLSGGQAQRIMIARSLYQGCRILLMDEPTSALDAETKFTLVNDLKRLVASERESTPSSLLLTPQTIIAVTHDEALLAMADVVVDLRR